MTGRRDHEIALRAGLLAAKTKSIAFYEDLPYAVARKNSDVASVVATLEAQLRSTLVPVVFHIHNALQFKEKCLRLYKSQILDSHIAKILDHAKNIITEKESG